MTTNGTWTFEQGGLIDIYPEWSLYFENIYMGIVALLGVPGNLLCIIIQIKFMKSSTDYFIFTMAMFDFVCAAVNAPLYIIRNRESLYTVFNSTAYCMIHKMFIYITSVSTSSLLCAVAVNRYFLTCHPFSRTYFKLILRVKEINISIAVFSFVVCAWIVVYEKFDEYTGSCQSVSSVMQLILKGVIMMVFIALFAVGSVCYIKVVMTIKEKHKLLKNRQREISSCKKSSNKKAVLGYKINGGLKRKLWYWIPVLKLNNKVQPMGKQTVSTLSAPGTSGTNEKTEPASQAHVSPQHQDSKGTVCQLKTPATDQDIYTKKWEMLTNDTAKKPTNIRVVEMEESYRTEIETVLLREQAAEKTSTATDTQCKGNGTRTNTKKTIIKDPWLPILSTCSENEETEIHASPRLSSDFLATNHRTITAHDVYIGPNKDPSIRKSIKNHCAPRQGQESSRKDLSASNMGQSASDIAHCTTYNMTQRTPNIDHGVLNKPHKLPKNEHTSNKTSHKTPTSPQESSTTSFNMALSSKHDKTINKMTLMLFLITVLYIVTWILHWITAFINDVSIIWIRGLMRSCQNIFMINCVTNPLFYSLISSKFRTKVKSLFNCR